MNMVRLGSKLKMLQTPNLKNKGNNKLFNKRLGVKSNIRNVWATTSNSKVVGNFKHILQYNKKKKNCFNVKLLKVVK